MSGWGLPWLDSRLTAAGAAIGIGATMMAGNGRKDQSGGQVPMMLGLKLVWCGWHVSLCGGLRCSMFTEI